MDVSAWDNAEVVEWICSLNEDYEQYREVFESANWTGEHLMNFKKRSLLKLKISVEHRDDIKNAVKELKKVTWII